jgi:hypothetical protein
VGLLDCIPKPHRLSDDPLEPPSRQIWVVTDYSGPQRGTQDQPWSIPANGWDAFMAGLLNDPEPFQVNAPAHFLTIGSQEWGASPWSLPSRCVLDFHGGILEWDYQNIPYYYVDSVPIHLILSQRQWGAGLIPTEAWKKVPVGQAIRNVTFIGNHSGAVDRFRSAGKNLLASAGVLQGHAARFQNIQLVNFGAWGSESFPLVITGAMDGLDRHALAGLDPKEYILDDDYPRSMISGVYVSGYDTASSNRQVSHCMIVGVLGNDTIADPWAEVGGWHQLFRRDPIIENCHGTAPDALTNQCQLATIYQGLGGEITGCSTRGYQAGVYGDYLSSFDLDVHHNDFEALRPVAQLLSPVDGGDGSAAALFSSDGLMVRSNTLRALPTPNDWHSGFLCEKFREGPKTQRISRVTVDDNDFIMTGAPTPYNVAIRTRAVDGLDVRSTNRYRGFPKNFDILDTARFQGCV